VIVATTPADGSAPSCSLRLSVLFGAVSVGAVFGRSAFAFPVRRGTLEAAGVPIESVLS
jgi:hypothetical protein